MCTMTKSIAICNSCLPGPRVLEEPVFKAKTVSLCSIFPTKSLTKYICITVVYIKFKNSLMIQMVNNTSCVVTLHR